MLAGQPAQKLLKNEHRGEPIRIFVGISANNEDVEFQSVLHYSLEKHASQPIDLTWMRLTRDPNSFWYSDPQKGKGWQTRSWHTPFSALRWGIPAACNFQGKAIYLDIDMIARADIAEFWNQEFKGNAVMIAHRPNICVSLIDCARMKNMLPPIEHLRAAEVYRNVRKQIAASPLVQEPIGGNWNCLDVKRLGSSVEYNDINDPQIKILHFTLVPTQPHLRYAIPRLEKEGRRHWYNGKEGRVRPHHRKDAIELFDRLFTEATEAGYGIERYLMEPFGDYGR